MYMDISYIESNLDIPMMQAIIDLSNFLGMRNMAEVKIEFLTFIFEHRIIFCYSQLMYRILQIHSLI